ncbi:response regulator transcription factor, partial [Saccharomonospora iraqiensis]|uniref:response regulator transcription factor n=1 Tax=Saccharomonospora iraqiensis TaxID=52698 RepID=UPI000593A1DA
LLRACTRADGDDSPDTAEALLAPRERDVLAEVARGLTNAEIAERLALRPETVKAYLRSAMRKLDVHSRHHAVAAARRAGLLP